MSVVLWDVALTSDDRPIWIHNYVNEEVYCADCKHPMIAVKGPEKQHHFRHKVASNCLSDNESALHYSKKLEIAEILKERGHVEVEGLIEGYRADVLFEHKWAFEVVIKSDVTPQKMFDLRDNLLVFNILDRNVWDPEDNYRGVAFDEDNFRDIVLNFAEQILNEEIIDVCSICRNVKGWGSRMKKGGICFKCDIGWSDESKKIEEYSQKYRDMKMR